MIISPVQSAPVQRSLPGAAVAGGSVQASYGWGEFGPSEGADQATAIGGVFGPSEGADQATAIGGVFGPSEG
jgi:hypothetical protein